LVYYGPQCQVLLLPAFLTDPAVEEYLKEEIIKKASQERRALVIIGQDLLRLGAVRPSQYLEEFLRTQQLQNVELAYFGINWVLRADPP
ncbi:MAG: hypothetical protein GX589_05070, partial [Deltaproteobacteria bacterium]|nr:hypothetical protein [Deltaproteobacteria bacterium]